MFRNTSWARHFAVVALMLSGSTALAQVAPLPVPPSVNPDAINAETLRRQEQLRQQGTPAPAAPSVSVNEPGAVPTPESAVRFLLRRVDFSGSAYLQPAELQAIAASYVGREVGLADLRALTDAINARYRALGVATARAVLPAQSIGEGVVRIELVEGRVGDVRIQGGSAVGQARARAVVDLEPQALADVPSIEEALLRFNRTSDAQLRAELQPGTSFGKTDILLSLFEPKRFQADIFIDSNGFESTGVWQGGAILRAHRLLSADDRLTGSLILSDGVTTGAGSYTVALANGVRLGASYARGDTRVTRGEFADLGVAGTSDTAAINFALLLASGRTASLTATATGQLTDSRTRVAETRVGDTELYSGELGLTAAFADAGLQMVLQQSYARVRATERLLDIRRGIDLFRGSASAQAVFGPVARLRMRGDWQIALQKDLSGVLQYQVGGRYSSRAFAPGLAGGDSGFSFSVEAGAQMRQESNVLEPYLFVDHAEAISRQPQVQLTSAGAGFSLDVAGRVAVEAYWAQRLSQPAPGLQAGRAMISATLRF